MKAYHWLRPLLFSLPPELAHRLALSALQGLSTLHHANPIGNAPLQLMGLNFANRIGLAAGLDKNGEYLSALSQLGWGAIEVGTVTPLAQTGNPRPRLFRLPTERALINRMGFNNDGLSAFVARLHAQLPIPTVLGINLGKNAVTPNESALSDYLLGLEMVYALADYVTINISSPNTKNLRDLQDKTALTQLLQPLLARRDELQQQHGKRVPLVIKLSPDMTDTQSRSTLDTLATLQVDGIIACNTTLSRPIASQTPSATETGGLSGAPLSELALEQMQKIRAQLGRAMVLIGSGGIMSANDACERIAAGADLVQLYTGLIYYGPGLIHDCVHATDKMAAQSV